MATIGSGSSEKGFWMTFQSGLLARRSVPIMPRRVAKGTPFWAARKPAWTAGQVASITLTEPSRTARVKQGAPPASPSVMALVSMVATQPAPISMSGCMPPVGRQTT